MWISEYTLENIQAHGEMHENRMAASFGFVKKRSKNLGKHRSKHQTSDDEKYSSERTHQSSINQTN